MSEQFKHTKLNLERTEQNLKARKSEFIYRDTKGIVPENKTYSVYYLTSKTKLFFTNLITSKTVRELLRVNHLDNYDIYSRLKGLKRELYPSKFSLKLKEKDYKNKSTTRFFIQKANDKNALVYEISESDFNKNLTLYNKTSFNWVISGNKEDARSQNRITIKNTEQTFKGISKLLFPLQYWRPSKDTPVTLEKKLSLLKKT